MKDTTILKAMKRKEAQGDKFDQEKTDWSLMPFEALQEVADVLTYGKKKYARDNWKVVPESRARYFAAGCRHLFGWFRGESKDPETGKSHLAHAICCLLFLLSNDLNSPKPTNVEAKKHVA